MVRKPVEQPIADKAPEPDVDSQDLGFDDVVAPAEGATKRLVTSAADWLGGGGRQRIQRAEAALEKAFSVAPETSHSRESAARLYGKSLRLSLRLDPSAALRFLRAYDARVPDGQYESVFGASAEDWLAGVAKRGDRQALTVVFEVAVRVRLSALQLRTRNRLADMLSDERDANIVVVWLRRWQDLGLLDARTVRRALKGHVALSPLDRDSQLWSAFFAHLPHQLLPGLFEVHLFLGRGSDAVRLADSAAREEQAIACCVRSELLEDVRAGLELARRRMEHEAVRALQQRAGDLLLRAGDYADALPFYEESGCDDRASVCHEHLGRYFEALVSCPATDAERVARLVESCRPDVDDLVERRLFVEAAVRVQELIANLDRVAVATDTVTARRSDIGSLRDRVLAAGRRHFQGQAGPHDTAVFMTWSRFEEAAGELMLAARRAEQAHDLYRASGLYRQAGHFGDADRVLKDDGTPQALAARAEAREAGGDQIGAARLFDQAGRHDSAVGLFIAAGEYAAAARLLAEWLGDDAIEDARMAFALRRTGNHEELIRLCLRGVERMGTKSRGAGELRSLRDESAVPPAHQQAVDDVLHRIGRDARRPFEERAQAWVAQARAEIDERFAGIWGLDLGTSTSAVAIYDKVAGEAVLCPWKADLYFASTLSVDQQGNELVGLSAEGVLAPWVIGHISGSKRNMGRRTTYKIRDRGYHPEEIAARLIRHARGMVENHLAAQVRERVGELARRELPDVRPEWLAWAEQQHDLRLRRTRALITIPAYFTNNQKHATRTACEIAGVEVVRLIHEPTAACLAAGLMSPASRPLSGSVVVVDLGAGTLDVSMVDVGDGVYAVEQVLGDNHYGGRDLDDAVTRALAARLAKDGIRVPEAGRARRRLGIAAEDLKIQLSSQTEADYLLLGFVDDQPVRLELNRQQLDEILAEPLRTLRDTCTRFKESLTERTDHLLLVGRPMLSPLIRGTIESIFGGVKRTVVADPRTAVACGAALQAAVLDGALADTLLIDVTPLALGILALDDNDDETFSTIIAANSRIPTSGSQIYRPHDRTTTQVAIEIFNGQLGARSKIGQFWLTDISRDAPQDTTIEVTFAIDASCVLEVTARETLTGRSNSIRLTDTTLLSRDEIAEMADSYRRERERSENNRALLNLHDTLRELIAEATSEDSEAAWREFRNRFAAHRPTDAPLEADEHHMLYEMYNEASELEQDTQAAQRSLRELADAATQRLTASAPGDVPAELADTQRTVDGLVERLEVVRSMTTRLSRWNALLVRLALTDPDPLYRFRNHHDAGDFYPALDAWGRTPDILADVADVDRYLRCLAEVGDSERYRDVLVANSDRLEVVLLHPERPEVFVDHIRPALVRLRAVREAGEVEVGSGFIAGERLVVTTRHQLGSTPIRVDLSGEVRSVLHVALADPAFLDVAVLRFDGPPVAAPRLRTGHPKLVRIGDRVWIPGRDTGLTHGIVDRFESFPEYGLHLFRVEVDVALDNTGSPVLNDLGEVIGILTVKAKESATSADGVFAVAIDTVEPLLALER
ncbi:MAG: Hsp70 family protein [Kibdelosporangium sp.]